MSWYVRISPGLLRDSKLGAASPVLVASPAEWGAFTAAVNAGRLLCTMEWPLRVFLSHASELCRLRSGQRLRLAVGMRHP
ncbi:MAG: DUF397 domain-containing protein [Pseudonocardiaceae bacterium]